MKQLATDAAAAAVSTGKSYLIAGILGLSIEESTGYNGTIWIAMFIGAFVIRKTPEGAYGAKAFWRSIWKGCSAVALAWVCTNAIAEWVGVDGQAFKVAIAALVAGMSETIIEYLRHPEKILALRASLKGGGDAT